MEACARMFALLLLGLLTWGPSTLAREVQCPHPAVPLYARVTLSNEARPPSTTATYTCDDGYELFGSAVSTCQTDGSWAGTLPYCAVNVAYGKPANQSSTARGGDAKHANDGDVTTLHEDKYCTETKVENSPWWRVDLLQPYDVRVIRIISRGCCGHQPLHDVEIRVGNSSSVQGNRLCAWYPGTIEDGVIKDFQCAYPINGRYVFIQMVGIQGSLSMCEVMVFTTLEFSPGRCGNQLEPLELTTFNRTCFEFQSSRGGSFSTASEHCRARGGLLAHRVEPLVQDFLAAELERRKDQLKSKLVWLGARRDAGLYSRTWHWVDDSPVREYLWADDQPNNYNGQQDCAVLDGGRKWLWNDVTCELDYLPWVCQYTPSNCGSPDRQVNSTVEGADFRLGQAVAYRCPPGNMVVGDRTRRCGSDGFWTGRAPSCKYVECPSLPTITHGRVIYPDARTTYNATAQYLCDTNYTLVGNSTRWCQGDSSWNGTEPRCLYGWCGPLTVPPNAEIQGYAPNLPSQAVVRYTCATGHKLLGNENRTCLLGGKWSGEDPICQFIDCNPPFAVRHGRVALLNGTTTFRSVVAYNCDENYTLVGDRLRTCRDSGQWSSEEPECRIIECGEPDIPPGAYLLNHSFTVHSVVEYRCEAGHQLVGDVSRTCLPSGAWSGDSPSCKYVDCGRVPPLLKGEIQYLNRTTHLGSTVGYSCIAGFRLQGQRVRECRDDGRWSGSAAKCEEVRCPPPEVPKNTTVVYGGNDRSSLESFKIGATVQYRCLPGHQVQGHPLRTCAGSGLWSGHPPACVYIDCSLPRPVAHGHWLLPSNTTHYGSQAEYRCDPDFEVAGPQRRLCLENGSWSGSEPVCQEVSCGEPDRHDDKTIVKGSQHTVGGRVNYTCLQGYELSGNVTRTCLPTGKWSGDTPRCKLVDCGNPTVIANGRGFMANGTTYRSVVTYQCLPDFQLLGDSVRTCLINGKWSGLEPKCTDLVVLNFDNVDGRRAEDGQGPDANSSKTVGIAVAAVAAAILILTIIAFVVCLKSKKQAPAVKRPETIEVQTRGGADGNKLSYQMGGSEPPDPLNGAIRANPNGLMTFNPQPIYANVTVNGQNMGRPQRPVAMHSQPV